MKKITYKLFSIMLISLFVITIGFIVATQYSYAAAKPGKPIIKKKSSTYSTVYISWKKQSRSKYQIQFKKRTAKKYKNLSKATKKTYIEKKNLKDNTKYTFRVRSILNNKKSKWRIINIKTKLQRKGNKDKLYFKKHTIYVNQFEKITLSAYGSKAKEAVWDTDIHFADPQNYESGATKTFKIRKEGTGEIVIWDSTDTYYDTVKIVSKEFREIRKTISGVNFEFGRIDDILCSNSITWDEDDETEMFYYPDQLIDPDDISLDISCGVAQTFKVEMQDYTQFGYVLGSAGKLLGTLEMIVYKDNFTGDDDMYNKAIQLYVDSRVPKTVMHTINLYYKNEKLDTLRCRLDKDTFYDMRNATLEKWEKECWTEDMSVEEKINALSAYIADTFNYSQYDCIGGSSWVFNAARYQLGLPAWYQYQDAGNGYQSTGIGFSTSHFAGHQGTVIVLNGKQYMYNVQGGLWNRHIVPDEKNREYDIVSYTA